MTMATLKIVFWALAFVFFVVCEVATGTALVSIWLAIAALIAMFCAIAKLSFLTQCIVFVVSSIILLLLTRPVVKKLQNKTVATNYELDVGKTAIVADGKATKIIIPSEIQGIAGLATGLKEVMTDVKKPQ